MQKALINPLKNPERMLWSDLGGGKPFELKLENMNFDGTTLSY